MKSINMTLNHGEELVLKAREFTVEVMHMVAGLSVEIITADGRRVNLMVDSTNSGGR
mgnify:CR=1 FL=1